MDPTRDQKNQTGQNQPTIIPQDQEAPAPPAGPVPDGNGAGGPTPAEAVVPEPIPTPVPQVPEEQKTPEPVISPVSEEAEAASLPPIISPPQKKKGLPISMFGIIALLLLVVSIPIGVFLVKQTQELRSQAYNAADCDQYGGLARTADDCDVNTNRLVGVFVCNNPCPEITGNETENCRLPGAPTGQECPQAPGPPAGGAPSLIESDADGPGGCCNPDAAANSAQGCRRGSGFNEVCDVSNGACASGFSCRSLPGTGCEQDTDCGPGNECKDGVCKPIPPATGQYTSCASWGYSDDSSSTANPNCRGEGGFACRRQEGTAVCCYPDQYGSCFEGVQANRCEPLGNGTIKLDVTTELIEYHCLNQTSSTGSCSENRTSRGRVGPGEYTVTASGGNNCGGHQIDATGYCGSYVFRGACRSTQPILQCTAVKFYDTNWNLISNPQTIRAGQRIRIAVVSSPGSQWAEFRINGGASWEERTAQKNASSEFFIEKQISAGDGGRFSVEARVY